MRQFTSLTAAAAVLVTSIGFSATPAEARHRHGGWGYRHHDRVDAGDVIGGILILGTIAAIAGAASKKDRDRRSNDDRYVPPYPENDSRDRTSDYQRRDDIDDGATSDAAFDQRAADACSWAVEGELGGEARVDEITDTQPNGEGWYVTGVASESGGAARSFGCTYRGGRVVDVSFG